MSYSVITRDFIHPEFTLYSQEHSCNKDQLIDMIRFWKVLLWEKYKIRRGSKIGIACLELDPYHFSLIFACSELGCQLVILDHPISEHTIHKTKAALFSPIDLGIVDTSLILDQQHQTMMETYCSQIANISIFDTYEIDDHNNFKLVADKFYCLEDDVLILASTSGTTSNSKPVLYKQKYVAELSIRNSKIFNYTKDSNVIHIRNMHHASSILLHFLPTVYACASHWHKYTNFNQDEQTNDFVNLIVEKQINVCLLCNQHDLDSLILNLQKNNITFNHRIEFNISGFLLTKQLLDQIKNHNMIITSTFGSVDTGVPVFINQLDKDSNRDLLNSGLIGYFPDDGFYKIVNEGNLIRLECPNFWEEPRYLNDNIKEDHGRYYHLQRDNVIQIGSCEFNLSLLTEYVKLSLSCEDLLIVVDIEYNCLYLVIWDNPSTIIELSHLRQVLDNSEFKNCSYIFKKIKNLHKKMFTVDTKVSVDQLRGYLQVADV